MTPLPPHDLIVTTRESGALTVRTTLNPTYKSLQHAMETMVETWQRGEGEEIFKGRNTVRRMTIGGQRLAVKRYGRLSAIKSIIYTYIRPGKAMRAFVYSLEYLRRGIPTPRGVAAIEVYRHNLLVDSYFVSQLSEGTMLFPELVTADAWDRVVARQVGDFIFEMHRRGIINRDPNLKNILSQKTHEGTRMLEAIDINRSVFTDENFPRPMIVRNLARVTHRRPLLEEIVTRYAERAGEPSRRLIDAVTKCLDKIERNRKVRHAIRDLFKKKKF